MIKSPNFVDNAIPSTRFQAFILHLARVVFGFLLHTSHLTRFHVQNCVICGDLPVRAFLKVLFYTLRVLFLYSYRLDNWDLSDNG